MSRVVSPLIQQFLDQKVEVTEHARMKKFAGLGSCPVTVLKVVPGDPTITALKKVAKAEGLRLNVSISTWQRMSELMLRSSPPRLHVHILKAPDGSHYRIDALRVG